MFLRELHEKHEIDDAMFLIDDAGIVLDSNNEDAWAESLYGVLADEELRSRLVKRGKELGQEFS